MAKFKKQLVADVKKEIKEKKKQDQLHEKYQINENLVVVEKSNMVKFLIRTILLLIRTIAAILVIILAVIGLLSLIYPEARTALTHIYEDTVLQIRQFLPYLKH